MLSPAPLSLICALLICLHFAFFITAPTSAPTAVSDALLPPKPLPLLSAAGLRRRFFSLRDPPLPRDDPSLLLLASRVNSKPPPGTPKKIAFLFLTITPLPFAPLWELYFNEAPTDLFNIYVHADPTHQYDPPFSGFFAGRIIHSKPSIRFTQTLTSAARRLLAHALLHDPSNYMFVLLSAACIPIHSFNFTYATLTRSRKSFIEILENEPWAYDRWAARGADVMLPEVSLEDFRIGSQFWALTRRHAKLAVKDRQIWAKFDRPCVTVDTCYPEENYFPTLIHMRDPRGSVSATLTYVNWTDSQGGHPRMYLADEVGPVLISTLRKMRPRYGDDGTDGSDLSLMQRNDHFLFARKFSPDSIQPLMSIANDVILKD